MTVKPTDLRGPLAGSCRYAGYCRVSTEDQSVEQQEAAIRRYGGDAVVEVVTEVESSRGTRPKKYSLYQRLLKREFDGVIVWKLDRWGRSVQELVNNITELHDRGINFISITENIDLSTSAGKLQFHIISAFAEFERSIISERTKEGLKRAVRNGKQLGRPQGAKDKKVRRKGGYYGPKKRGYVK